MSDIDLYNKMTEALKAAGFELVRNGKHENWRNEDRSKGVVLRYKIRDKNMARALLRSVGVEARL
jgi:hypothetical protein